MSEPGAVGRRGRRRSTGGAPKDSLQGVPFMSVLVIGALLFGFYTSDRPGFLKLPYGGHCGPLFRIVLGMWGHNIRGYIATW